VRPSLLGLKVAAVTAVGTVALGGVAAAATGSLPGPLSFGDDPSQSADPSGSDTAGPTDSGSPSESASATDSASPTDSGSPSESAGPTDSAGPAVTALPTSTWTPSQGPNPFGPAAWGLCHAFGNKTWGNGATGTQSPNPAGRKPDNPSVAYANLVAGAASVGLTVDQFCTLVLAGPQPTGSAGPEPSGSPAPSESPQATSKHGNHGHGHGHGHGATKQHGHDG
jgi:hypothetical protein